MPARYAYHVVVRNDYLGVSRMVGGMTRQEAGVRANEQLARWAAQEAQKRERDRRMNLQARAEQESRAAQGRLNALRNLLRNGLAVGRRFQWAALKDARVFPPFQFNEPAPTYQQVMLRLQVPAPKGAIEAIFPSVRQSREQMEAKARYLFGRQMADHSADVTPAL